MKILVEQLFHPRPYCIFNLIDMPTFLKSVFKVLAIFFRALMFLISAFFPSHIKRLRILRSCVVVVLCSFFKSTRCLTLEAVCDLNTEICPFYHKPFFF